MDDCCQSERPTVERQTKCVNAKTSGTDACEMPTCGLSCLNALNALFAKLVAVAIAEREGRETEGERRSGLGEDRLH